MPAVRPRLLVVTSLMVVAALTAWAAVRFAQARAEVERARALLLAGDPERALALFARVQRLPGLRVRATSGQKLAQAFLGQDPGGILPSETQADFPAQHLLVLAAAREPGGGGRRALATLLARSGERLAALDLAALELDAGQDALAAGRLASDPAAFQGRALGREIRAVLAERASGAVTVVRDRLGRRLGYLTNQRRLVLEEDVDRDLVPEAAREATAAANPAAGARLSLDLDLSRLAKAALEDARGSVVLLDPHTGSVLAAVSDSVTLQTGGTPAFEDRREPASISKIVTTAAAMRAGINPDAFLKRLECRGATRIGRGTVWCSYPAGPLEGLDHALAVSCNMAFAHLGLEVGRAALLDELARWGFGRDFAPWAPGGRVLQPAGDPRQLADLAIGLEATDLTPLHGALLAAVVGNDGHMPEPVLIEGESGPLSLAWHPPPRAPARDVIDRAAVKVLTRAMVAVAVRGTAAGVAPRDFPVAMKTGTGAERRRGYHANYVGVAPWPNPVVAFSVRVTHEPTSARVNRTARLVLGRLLEALRRNLCAPDAPPQGLTATWRWKPEGSRSRPLVCS